MKRMARGLSLFLCFIMILGLLPVAAVPVQAANSDPYIGVLVTGNGYTKRGSEYELNITEEKLIKEGSGAFSASGESALCTDANCETKLDEDPRLGRTYYFRIYFAYYSEKNYALTDANSTIEIGGFSDGKLVSFQRNGAYLEVVCSVKYGEEISRVNAVGTGYGYDSEQGGYAPIFSTLEAYTSDGKKVEQEDFVWHYTFYTSASFNPSVKLTTEPVNGETYYFAIYVDMYDDGILYDYDLDSIKENSTVTIPGFEVEYYRFMEREMGSYMEIAYAATKRDPEVWVGGVGMYDGDYLAVGATATTQTQPSSGYAYYKDGKLTLNNYRYEGKGYEYNPSKEYCAIIYAKRDLTVELLGTNTLKQTKADSEAIYAYNSNLTIQGDGSLTYSDNGYGIFADKTITVNGGSITTNDDGYNGLRSEKGDIIINGGNVTAFGDIALRSVSGSVKINGGTVTVTGITRAIDYGVSGSFTVTEGLTVQASTTVDGELGAYVAENHDSYKKIVVSETPIIQDPDQVVWVSASTTLGGNIGLNFYVELADFLVNDPSTYMHFTFADQVVSVPLSQAVKSTGSNGKTQYKFTCPVNAKNMADAVCAQVMTDGGAVGMPKSLAVVTYCNFMIQYSNDANLVSLMKSMLNYGASAQLLFNHNTGNLANAGLSEADKTLPVIDASAYAASVSGSEEGIILASATLSLETETTIRIYFSLTGSKPIDQYSFYVNGSKVTPQQKGGQYFIEITDIAAQDLDAMHTITVGGLTVKYAGLSYVATVLKNPDIAGEILVNTAKALFVYNDKAETYFNS